jgi:putative hydrolase of the HAD superfamily
MITHLLFDFFGTLVDYSESRTEQGYERSYAILLENGATFSYETFLERWSALAHQFDLASETDLDEYSMDDVVSRFLTETLGPDFAPAVMTDFRDTYLQEWSKGVCYIEGVPALLSQLKERYTLVLVTNTHSGDFVRSHLRGMGITEHFSRVVTSIEHGKRKPCAAIFQDALKASGGEHHNALYIGDSFANDYIGATGVGMRCLLIDPHKKHDIPAQDRITHILDLQDVLSKQ